MTIILDFLHVYAENKYRFFIPTNLIIALTMEAISTSETSASYCHNTLRNIPEDSHHLTRRRENPKSHLHLCMFGCIVYGLTDECCYNY
jgi:hypothetical protein